MSRCSEAKALPVMSKSTQKSTAGQSRAPVVLSARAASQLRAYDRAVSATIGGDEFCMLLLGVPGERRVEEGVLALGQEVTYSTFTVSPEKLSETNAAIRQTYPGLATIGIAHRHPGPAGGAFHSVTDDRYIAGQLAPMLALLSLQARRWERELEPEQNEDELVYTLDRSGRQRLRLRWPRAEQAEVPAAEFGLTLAVEERHTEVFSIVFTSCMQLYCCELEYEFPTLLTPDGTSRSWRKVTRHEPRVEIEETEETFEFDQEALRQEVREQVHPPRVYGDGWCSSSGSSVIGAQGNRHATSHWASDATGARTTGSGAAGSVSHLFSSTSRTTQTTRDLLRDAAAKLREVSRRRSELDLRGGASLGEIASGVTALLEKVIDESWPDEVH